MNNELKIFEHEAFGSIRTVEVNGEPWFVGREIAGILGYSNTQKAIRDHVDEEDKLAERIVLSGQNREVFVINESGLYSLILSSKLPAAKQFKHWVTSEVLPTIRRHGLYSMDELLENPEMAVQAMTKLLEERKEKKRLQHQLNVKNQQLAEMRPKATYYDLVLSCTNAVPISVIAKDYGWSARKMNRFLQAQGVQYKCGGVWLLKQAYADKGYTNTKTHTYQNHSNENQSSILTCWTQKGRLFIYELMKQAGNLPLIEQAA